MKRYWKIFWVILKNVYTRDSKINGYVVVNVLTQFLYTFLLIVFFGVIFDFTDNLAGWNFYQVLFLFGFARAVTDFSKIVYRSGLNSMAGELVRLGEFDFYLTKPADAMILVSISKPNLYTTLAWLFDLSLMVYAIVAGDLPIQFANLLWFIFLAIVGFILYFFLSMLLVIPSFWVQRLFILSSLIGKFSEIFRYPMGMFNMLTKIFAAVIFPILVVTYVPVKTLFYPPEWYEILYLVAITFIFGLIVRLLWDYGVRGYSSASS
jgi:ABC-2 type transport system permease protein